ncbi:MAG: hypothetical protein NTZ09_05850 [Candidatus Hydrogenedentes bacterium]|nr:hypothetical protein [Candidatus Hydrogenedentota bacterium]
MSAKPKLNRDGLRLRLKMLQAENPVAGPTHEVLRGLLAESAAPGEDLAWLAAHDLDPEVSSGAFSALFYALRGDDVKDQLRARVREHAAPVLLRALKSRRMPDSRKYSIGPLYSFCVGEIPGDDYRAFFADFEKITNRMIEDAIQGLRDDPKSVDRVLTGMEALLDGDACRGSRFAAAQELAEHMLSGKPAAAATLCGAAVVTGWLEEDVRDTRLNLAFKLLEKTAQPQAVWLLEEMARWPGMGELPARARRSAQKMELQGVCPDYPMRSTFSHGLVTAPDGLGSRQMALFYATPDGGVDALLFLYGEAVGLKDIMCIFEEGAEVERELRDRARDLAMAACGLDLAREFLADALARHCELKTAPPANLIIYRPYLGAFPISPCRRTPDLSPYGLTVLAPSPELVVNSERLAASPFYGMFMFTSDKAYAYFEETAERKGSPHLPPKMLDRFLREVAIEERDTLLDRLAATLEVELWAGRARHRINQTAARTWLGMSGNVLPFDQVPYVRAVGKMSARMIIENLQMGFHTQREVNEAALRAEQQS